MDGEERVAADAFAVGHVAPYRRANSFGFGFSVSSAGRLSARGFFANELTQLLIPSPEGQLGNQLDQPRRAVERRAHQLAAQANPLGPPRIIPNCGNNATPAPQLFSANHCSLRHFLSSLHNVISICCVVTSTRRSNWGRRLRRTQQQLGKFPHSQRHLGNRPTVPLRLCALSPR